MSLKDLTLHIPESKQPIKQSLNEEQIIQEALKKRNPPPKPLKLNRHERRRMNAIARRNNKET